MIVFPLWILKEAKYNLNFREKFSWMLEGLRVSNHGSSLYYFFFLVRRLILVLLLTLLPDHTVTQLVIALVMSFINILYLLNAWPYTKTVDNAIELFNEACTFSSIWITITLLDPAMTSEARDYNGWVLIYLFGANILINLLLVSN